MKTEIFRVEDCEAGMIFDVDDVGTIYEDCFIQCEWEGTDNLVEALRQSVAKWQLETGNAMKMTCGDDFYFLDLLQLLFNGAEGPELIGIENLSLSFVENPGIPVAEDPILCHAC